MYFANRILFKQIMKKIAIFGAGGFGREVLMLINQINQEKKTWEIIGFFDDGIPKNKIINGLPVLGNLKDLNFFESKLNLIIAIGSPRARKNIVEQINNNKIQFPTLIHPRALLGEEINIGEGSIITANCILTCNIQIGKHAILNLGSHVGHDCILGDYASLMPRVSLAGEVVLSDGVFIGMSAQVINQLKIGKNAFIGAGAVVTQSIPDDHSALAIPAKRIKYSKYK